MVGLSKLPTEPSGLEEWLAILRSPGGRARLQYRGGRLVAEDGTNYPIDASGIPLFAEVPATSDALLQQQHYERIAKAYFENLSYPHTEAYMAHLDAKLREVVPGPVGLCAEICCGRGEAIELFGSQAERAIGLDISLSMLKGAKRQHTSVPALFIQGDATSIPISDEAVDSVFMLGGIHHVPDRAMLFREVARILKPGGHFYFREPVSDFPLWLWLRWLVYRLSPTLDHETEKPLRFSETQPFLCASGLELVHWRTHGFLGFCFFMNSDVLVFNKAFRFIPGIRALTRVSAWFDEFILKLPGFSRWGLQVIGVARKSGA